MSTCYYHCKINLKAPRKYLGDKRVASIQLEILSEMKNVPFDLDSMIQ